MTKILLIEDNPLERFLYNHRFEQEGHQVIQASNGQEALEYLQTLLPDIVILDINMPGMDGLETLGRIHDLNCQIPVILHTAYDSYQEQFVSWIADAYVVKSSNLDKLCHTVRETLARRKADHGEWSDTNASERLGRDHAGHATGGRQG